MGGGYTSRCIMKIQLIHTYNDIISVENLCLAWQEFIIGKKKKEDVVIFARNLMDNILSLHNDLANHTYRHGGWVKHKLKAEFYIRYADDFVFLS